MAPKIVLDISQKLVAAQKEVVAAYNAEAKTLASLHAAEDAHFKANRRTILAESRVAKITGEVYRYCDAKFEEISISGLRKLKSIHDSKRAQAGRR